jgi:hypothetical protein
VCTTHSFVQAPVSESLLPPVDENLKRAQHTVWNLPNKSCHLGHKQKPKGVLPFNATLQGVFSISRYLLHLQTQLLLVEVL